MWHRLWQSFPIWVISSSKLSPDSIVPGTIFVKSNPLIIRFSPKLPKFTGAPFTLKFSILSKQRRLTCLCQFPPWASFSSPKSSIKLIWRSTFLFRDAYCFYFTHFLSLNFILLKKIYFNKFNQKIYLFIMVYYTFFLYIVKLNAIKINVQKIYL